MDGRGCRVVCAGQRASIVELCAHIGRDNILIGLQKRELSIALAIADIYVLDFVINVGKNVLLRADRLITDRVHSPVNLSSSSCRHSPSREATAWLRLGYACLHAELIAEADFH